MEIISQKKKNLRQSLSSYELDNNKLVNPKNLIDLPATTRVLA